MFFKKLSIAKASPQRLLGVILLVGFCLWVHAVPSSVKASPNEVVSLETDLIDGDKMPSGDELIFLPSHSHACAGGAVLLITGPGGKAFGPRYVISMKKALEKCCNLTYVETVGDGKTPIDPQQVKDAIFRTQGLKPLIIVNAHGEMREGRFIIDLGLLVAIQDLFRDNTSPANVFLMCCHSGGALVPGVFPKNSRVVALCEETEWLSETLCRRFVGALEKRPGRRLEADSLNLLLLYLVKGLPRLNYLRWAVVKGQPFMPPSEFMVNDIKYNVDQILESGMGKIFSEDKLERVRRQLKNIMSEKEMRNITLKTLKIQGLQSFWDISGSEYGPAMAIMLAAAESSADLPSYNTEWKTMHQAMRKKMPIFEFTRSRFIVYLAGRALGYCICGSKC